jgi:hypothetical protein
MELSIYFRRPLRMVRRQLRYYNRSEQDIKHLFSASEGTRLSPKLNKEIRQPELFDSRQFYPFLFLFGLFCPIIFLLPVLLLLLLLLLLFRFIFEPRRPLLNHFPVVSVEVSQASSLALHFGRQHCSRYNKQSQMYIHYIDVDRRWDDSRSYHIGPRPR